MSHFPTQDWLEFARGTESSEQGTAMQDHLNQGCKECLIQAETWRTVLEIAHQDIAHGPPESTVRLVKSAYLTERPSGQATAIATIAHLVFDSFLQPAPAGLRSAMSAIRQLIHEADPFVIDIRVESDPGGKRVCLMGQVLNSKKPDRKGENIEVVLLSGERQVGQIVANSSGEFLFDFSERDKDDLRLLINIYGHKGIRVVLPGSEA